MFHQLVIITDIFWATLFITTVFAAATFIFWGRINGN